MFFKRNLLAAVAAAEKLIKSSNGYQLKVETTWYYHWRRVVELSTLSICGSGISIRVELSISLLFLSEISEVNKLNVGAMFVEENM